MDTPTPSDAPRLPLSESELLAVEYDLPATTDDVPADDERFARFERERYDAQNLGALIAP